MYEIPEYNQYGSHLMVRREGDFYAMDIYKSFENFTDLEEYVEEMFGTKNFEYFYGNSKNI